MSAPHSAAAPRSLGRSGLTVTALGLGCAPLGNLFRAVTDTDARATVDAAWRAGIRLFDTAPLYGSGLSEARLGAALAGRRGAVVASKVGRVLRDDVAPDGIFVDVPSRGPVRDYSEAGVRTSFGESCDRLAVDHLDICWVHDPDEHEGEAASTALPELARMRAEGLVGAVGVGMNQAEMLARFVRAGLVDAVLIAGRCSLLDHHAFDELLPACADEGVGVVVGGVFNSGLLADPWAPDARFEYAAAPSHLAERARRMAGACERHGVPLAAAALQFPFRHPAVSAVLVGARTAGEVEANVAAFATSVPDALWEALASQRLVAPHVVGLG